MTDRTQRARARTRALGAGVVAGLALWCTRGALEVVAGPDGPLRVALLPSPWQAISLVAAAAGAALGLAHLVAWGATGQHRELADADADVTRPLIATGVLTLPYLPWLPDAWPALTVLAGRFALIVWLVVVVLVAWAATGRVLQARSTHATTIPAGAALVLAAGLALYGGVAWRFAGSGLFPGGDEPHYLVLAQSLWRDRDFRIENNHQRGDTFEYYRLPLTPHYLERGTDGEIYSIHPVGLPLVAAPIYAAGGYHAVVAFIVLCAALAAAGAWLAARRITGSTGAATVAWIGAAATAPFVFNSITVYPEIPAAACAMGAWLLATRPGSLAGRLLPAIGCGLLLAALPWLSSKYALMMATLGVVALSRVWWPPAAEDAARAPAATRIRTALAVGLPMVISVAAWMAFFASIWGSPLPSVVYGSQRPVRWEYFVRGGPGLLFDQEYGIVPVAPVFAASLVGLALMLADRQARRTAIEVTAVFGALLIPVGAFHLWSGGSGAIGRPVVAALLLLGLPLAWLVRRCAANTAGVAAVIALAAASVGQMLVLLWAQQGLLLVAGRDGVSRLLEYWSPSWRLWSLAPSFLMQPPLIAWAFTAVWLAALAIATWAIARAGRRRTPGEASLLACGAGGGVLVLVSLVVPLALERWRAPAPPLGVRAQSTMLSDFDAQRRPLGLVYDPLRAVPASAIPPRLAFVAGPAARGERTGVDLLYDARWALPAGRYEVTLTSPRGPMHGELSLQVGRVGPPLRTWTIAPTRRWQAAIDLPANARFVGFRASPELRQAAPELRLTPRMVPDLRTRRTGGDVIQSRQYGEVPVFFADERVFPEAGGFWTRGDSASRFTVALSPTQPTALRVRAGAAPVTLRAVVDGREQRVSLAPDATQDLPLRSRHAVASVELATEGGFVPAERDPASRDRRRLGAWVEVIR